jgi:hypothetical protein
VLPNLTTVFSLLARDDTKIGVFESDGMSQMMRIVIRANTEPNKNGGPGKRCFKIVKDFILKRTNTFFLLVIVNTYSAGICGESFKLTLNIQNINPYIAGPMPLQSPRIPVTQPCETPC